MRKDRVIRFVRELLSEIGEDPNRESLRKTLQHVAELYSEIFSGYDATAELEVNFGEQ